ncbi:MAG: ABC transporter permease [Brevinemataceae bacterium]
MKFLTTIIKKNSIFIFFVLFAIIIAFIEPRFLSVNNVLNVFRQTSINAIIAAGMTLVILSGGIDLSVGSIFALSASIGAIAMINGLGFAATFIITLSTGMFFGAINGFLVGYLKIQAFIATLITMTFARGLTYIISGGNPITMGMDIPGINAYHYIGGGYFLGLPMPVIITILLYAVLIWLLSYTKFGRYTYAIGDNEKAAILCGIDSSKIKVILYTICGTTAALSALVLTSRLSSAPPTAGTGYELDAIAAVVLGGTLLSGGKGLIAKTLLGALIISVLANALNLLNVSSYYQMLVKSIVILIAVISHKNKS